ncbi:MAG: GatB/YqeY domain-containing protein [Flavobacteriales bacterium]|nr:GatB/YqeY domain-containing protein [Flavobacteriales bacterium]
MTLQDRISADMKEAMKARDKVRLAALRDIKSKIMLALTETSGEDTLDDTAVTKILSKQLKQREDTMVIYKDQGRDDLVAEEEAQAAVIRVYLPQPMTSEELAQAVAALVAELGATSMADMGRVMGAASAKFAGRADGKAISALVRSQLG